MKKIRAIYSFEDCTVMIVADHYKVLKGQSKPMIFIPEKLVFKIGKLKR